MTFNTNLNCRKIHQLQHKLSKQSTHGANGWIQGWPSKTASQGGKCKMSKIVALQGWGRAVKTKGILVTDV